ncbi:MAG: hypothetical protein ACLFRG_13485 [Desulfococcaceae bacterium]
MEASVWDGFIGGSVFALELSGNNLNKNAPASHFKFAQIALAKKETNVLLFKLISDRPFGKSRFYSNSKTVSDSNDAKNPKFPGPTRLSSVFITLRTNAGESWGPDT